MQGSVQDILSLVYVKCMGLIDDPLLWKVREGKGLLVDPVLSDSKAFKCFTFVKHVSNKDNFVDIFLLQKNLIKKNLPTDAEVDEFLTTHIREERHQDVRGLLSVIKQLCEVLK